jgi:hypothetical protein
MTLAAVSVTYTTSVTIARLSTSPRLARTKVVFTMLHSPRGRPLAVPKSMPAASAPTKTMRFMVAMKQCYGMFDQSRITGGDE